MENRNNYEQMTELRQKINDAKLLEEQLKDLEWDCDILANLIKCSSKEEVDSLLEEFFPHAKLSDTPLYNISLVEKLLSYKLLGIAARETNKKDIFVEFQPFLGHQSSIICMILLIKDNNGDYSLKDFNLPHKTPVDELKEKYLSGQANDVVKFVCALHRSVWAFWTRESYVNRIKTFSYLEKYQIYFNRSKTLITFQLDLVDDVKVEVCLLFKPMGTLPYEVRYTEINDSTLTKEHKAALEDLKPSLLQYPFPEVLRTNFEGISDDKHSDESKKDASGSESTRTIVFDDLFNVDNLRNQKEASQDRSSSDRSA